MNNKKGLMRFGSKSVLLIGALALIFCGTIGGSLAWMFDRTDPMTNTFTIGDISISLTESDTDSDGDGKTNSYSFEADPEGDDQFSIAKDAVVTVKEGSEDCWLFVKVEESDNFGDYLEYAMADGWKALDAEKHPGVWYRQVKDITSETCFDVLNDQQIYVKGDVFQEQLDALTEKDYPTLSFSAYAIQLDQMDTASDAWAKLDK